VRSPAAAQGRAMNKPRSGTFKFMTHINLRGLAIIAAGLLLVVGGHKFEMDHSRQPSKHREAVKKKQQPRPPAFDYQTGNSNWPYGPSYNFPYRDRPYGDPGHGGE